MLAGWLWVDAPLCTIHRGTDKSNREEKAKLQTAKVQIKVILPVIIFGFVDCIWLTGDERDSAASTAPSACGCGTGVLSWTMRNDCAWLCLFVPAAEWFGLTGSQLVCTTRAFQRANDFCHLTLDLVFALSLSHVTRQHCCCHGPCQTVPDTLGITLSRSRRNAFVSCLVTWLWGFCFWVLFIFL